MNNLDRNFREKMKAGFLILDYLLWLLLDISKFKIVRKSKIKKVLVTHQGAIGELLITTPILRTLKDRLGCEIVYMAPKGKAAIFENNPDVDKIVGFEDSFEANLKKIKKEKFDLALIVQAHFKIAYMCWKAGIPYRIGGFGGLNRAPSLFFTRKTFPLKGTHSIEKNLAIINTIGLDNKNPRYRAVVSTRERSSIKQKLKKLGIDRFFIVHPGFGSPKDPDKSRLWPVKRYSDLVNHLIDKYDTKIILGVGVKEEKNLTEKILSGVKRKNRVIDGSGMFGIRELLALIKESDLVVAPDTGISHMSAALSVPLVNLMVGARATPSEWGPLGDRDKIINLYHKNSGMAAIKLEEVKNSVEKILKR